MKPVFAIPLFLLALPMVAAEAPMSYVRVIESYSPSRSEPAAFFDMARVTTTYFDGLGRPVETVRVGAGGDFEDVAELTVYGTETRWRSGGCRWARTAEGRLWRRHR